MIIWTGRGILAPVIIVSIITILSVTADLYTGIDNYGDTHRWLYSIGSLLGGMACWNLGKSWNSKPGRILLDEKTGEGIEVKDSDTCYFIPFQYWLIVGIIVAIVILIY